MSTSRTRPGPWRRLPLSLKCAWLVIGMGVILLGWGYLNRIASMSWTGLVVFVAGYAWGVLDGMRRSEGRDQATPFYVALATCPVAAFVFSLICVVIAIVMFAGIAMFGDFSWGQVLRILHFIGVLFCTCILISLPGVARRTAAAPGEKGPEAPER